MKPKNETDLGSGFRAKLSFDVFTLVNAKTGRSSNEMYELEIEAINESASRRLADIAKNIRGVIPELKISSKSKYSRGVDYFKLTKSKTYQSFDNWVQGPGFNWVSLVLAVVGFILTITSFILTFL